MTATDTFEERYGTATLHTADDPHAGRCTPTTACAHCPIGNVCFTQGDNT